MQVPIVSGIYTDAAGDFRTSYPENMVPVPKENGISQGYLRPADGIVEYATGPGTDRGGVMWNGVHYRVMGERLVSVSSAGVVTDLGAIPGTSRAKLVYSFDRLAIAASSALYYYKDGILEKVIDSDLGLVEDVLWADGYFLTTDGVNIVQTELADPEAVNPLKYGSSEANPDGIQCLLKIRREVYAVNRFTTEVFDNVGGDFFAFQVVPGGQIEKGAVGRHSACVFDDSIAIVGSGFNEPPAVYLVSNGQSVKISTQEVESILKELSESDLETVYAESKADRYHQNLMIHLPDRCLVYDLAASKVMQQPVWHVLHSGNVDRAEYRARGFVYANGEWIAGDPTTAKLGRLTNELSTHYGQTIGWAFGTQVLYGDGLGAIVHSLELVSLTGNTALGVNPTIWTSYTLDGQTWSMEKGIQAGKQGERSKRLQWRGQGQMRHWRAQKFRGTSDTRISFARLEIEAEPLDG